MHERILISPNGTELLRMLARNGLPTLGLRVMQPAELARFALMRSGAALTERLLPAADEAALLYRELREIPYFRNASCHDAQMLTDTLRELRLQIPAQERETIVRGLQDSPFTEKNEALLAAYDRYMHRLREGRYLDTVGLLRLAIGRAEPLDMECMVLSAYPLKPLEQALLSHVSGGSCRMVSVSELIGIPSVQKLPFPCITEAYGAANEAEAVIGAVFDKQLPPDQCTIAVTDTAAYVPLLYELTSCYGIPASFGCGLPVTLSRAGGILSDYQHWQTDGYYGIDALRALLCGSGFDTDAFCKDYGIADRKQLHEMIQTAGSLRLGTDVSGNKALIAHYVAASGAEQAAVALLERIFVDFGMNCPQLVKGYTKIRNHALGRLDKAAAEKIGSTMNRFTAMTGEPADALIPELLQARVCAENSREGALHITTVAGALPALRSHLFVMGLSTEIFPGKPEENYLLLDHEYAAFGADAPTSYNRIRQTKETLRMLLYTAAALDIPAGLSYCGYHTAELKYNNASAMLFELYQEAGGTDEKQFRDAMQHTGYFSQRLPGAAEIGRAYLNNEVTAAAPVQPSAVPECEGIVPKLSPSAVETFVKCPKQFCCKYIMHLREPDADDALEVISAAALGELVHKAMEQLCQQPKLAKSDFLAGADALFDAFLAERPPLHASDAEISKAAFLRLVEQGYLWASDRLLTEAEQTVRAEYPGGIVMEGRPDALEQRQDGSLCVIDYKTGVRVKHIEEDLESCIQVMLYADMLRRNGKQAVGGEYWYLRHTIVPCSYTEQSADGIETILNKLADAVRQNHYPATPSADSCRYCVGRSICAERKE